MPRNQKLADTILTVMANHLLLYPSFEEHCEMDIDMGIKLIRNELIRNPDSVIKDTERSFVISYAIESEGSPSGILYTDLIGHAYQLPFFREEKKEKVFEDFLKTADHGGIIRDIGWYFIEQTIPPSIERRAA